MIVLNPLPTCKGQRLSSPCSCISDVIEVVRLSEEGATPEKMFGRGRRGRGRGMGVSDSPPQEQALLHLRQFYCFSQSLLPFVSLEKLS